MKFFCAALIMLLCAGAFQAAIGDTAGHATNASAPTPIASAAQLRIYLNRGGASPLDLLSPHARQRFIDSVQFGSNGVAGLSVAELEAELTQSEAREVLKLFGLERFTPPASQMRTARLNIGATETSDAGAQFGDLQRASRTRSPVREVAIVYDRWFRTRQMPTALRALSDGDLALAFRAATIAAGFDPAPRYAEDMRRGLAELHHRHLAASGDYENAYRALIRSRDFGAANDLRTRYPEAGLPSLPTVHDTVKHPGPTVLQLSADGSELERRTVTLDEPVHVIVIAGCHFARDAALDIERDPLLHKGFAQHVLWMTPQDGNPADPELIRWNREHPLTAMRNAYRETEWPQIDSWAMPTFYFFRDGKLDKKFVGWQKDPITVELRKLGLMP